MALTPEQKRVLAAIKRGAVRNNASPKQIKAAVETGLVESNLRQLNYGDADSIGWRQERKSLYPDAANLDRSVDRFYKETAAVKHKYGTAGALAAAVQRPREDLRGKYQERSADAEALLKGLGAGGGGGGSRTVTTPGTTTSRQVPDESARKVALAQYLLNRGNPSALSSLAVGLSDAVKTETTTTPGTTRRVASGGGSAPAQTTSGGQRKFKVAELFYDPGVSLDNGQKVAPIGGHSDHVHVSFGSDAGRRIGLALAKKYGLTVTSEGGGKHAAGSFHYRQFKDGKSQGVDFAGPPAAMARFNKAVAAAAKKT